MACLLSDEIAAVFCHNDNDTAEKWIPMNLEVGHG